MSPSSNNSSVLRAAQFPGDPLWDKSWSPGPGEATIQKRSHTRNPSLTLYSSWFCPFAQRTWIACEETGVNYLWKEINPYQVDPQAPGGYTKKSLSLEEKQELYPDFIEASPRGLVPAIAHDDAKNNNEKIGVWESLPCAEYVNRVFGDGSLLPTDPRERALTQIWMDHCTSRIQKHYYASLMAQSSQESQQQLKQCFTECRALARAMVREGGPFFWGDRFTLVDVALAPFWQRMLSVGGHYRQIQFPQDDPEFQRLDRWWRAVAARPSVAATFVSRPRLIASYADYARNVATSDFARNAMGSSWRDGSGGDTGNGKVGGFGRRQSKYRLLPPVCLAVGLTTVAVFYLRRSRQI